MANSRKDHKGRKLREGYLAIASASFAKQKLSDRQADDNESEDAQTTDNKIDENTIEKLKQLKKGMEIDLFSAEIKEGETSPPKRYNSGSMILAMENAGQLIDDEDLRAQIKGSGIGTSATRAEILSKLVNIKYLSLNKKTQIITPTLLGEMVYDVVFASIHALLNPELTASWELGLTMVADGKITEDEYMMKLNKFIFANFYTLIALCVIFPKIVPTRAVSWDLKINTRLISTTIIKIISITPIPCSFLHKALFIIPDILPITLFILLTSLLPAHL